MFRLFPLRSFKIGLMVSPRQLVLLVTGVCCILAGNQPVAGQDKDRKFPPASVVLSRVVSLKRANTETFVGTVMPIRKSVLGSPVGGRVMQVLVEEGDRVGLTDEKSEFDGSTLGQPIIQLRTTTLDMEIASSQAELKQRELEAQELKATLPIEIEQAEANLNDVQSRLEYSRAVFERYQELFKTNGVSARELQEAATTFRSQSELLLNAQAALRKLTSTEKIRMDAVDAVVENQNAEVRRLLELRENYTVRAPFDGFVVSKLTEVGQWVAPGQAIVEIVQLDPIELVVNVPQSFVQSIQSMLDASIESHKKIPVQVSIDSIDELLSGELIQVVPQADLRARTFPVKIRLANTLVHDRPLIKSGMLGRASFFVGDETEVLMVKKDALVLGQPTVVMVARQSTAPPNPQQPADQQPQEVWSAERVPVEIGAAQGEWIQVRGLLNKEDLVVVQGNERLLPGQTLKVLSRQTDGPPGEPTENPQTPAQASR